MGHLIDPPEHVEGPYFAVFMQTDIADGLAIQFLRNHGIDARPFPLMGDLAFDGFGGLAGGASLYGGQALVCVPEREANEALDLLEFDSGLVDIEDAESDEGEGS
jgi:hypothetical protein